VPSKRSNLSRIVSLILAALLASGCSTWRLQEGPPTTVLESAKKPPSVRLVLTNGEKIEVAKAVVLGDSVVGYAPRLRGTGEVLPPKRRLAVPVSEVRSVERRRWSAGGTLLIVVVAAGLALVMVGNSFELYTY